MTKKTQIHSKSYQSEQGDMTRFYSNTIDHINDKVYTNYTNKSDIEHNQQIRFKEHYLYQYYTIRKDFITMCYLI